MSGDRTSDDGSDIFWPGYVDAVTNLVLNLLFLLTIMTVAVFMFAMELGLLELGGVSLSVARHHRWDLFFSYVPSFDDFSPLAWCSL